MATNYPHSPQGVHIFYRSGKPITEVCALGLRKIFPIRRIPFRRNEMKKRTASLVKIQIQFNAPVEKVWSAWTDTTMISKWFGSDPNGRLLKVEMDVRAGGNFEITFRDSDGTEHTCFGIYKTVVPLHELSFTWNWKEEPGVESFVSVLFSPKNDGTEMQFEHADIGNASAHDYKEGWNATFLKLRKAVADR